MDIDMLQGELHIFESRIDMDGIYSFCDCPARKKYYLYVMKHVREIGIDYNDIKTLTDCLIISLFCIIFSTQKMNKNKCKLNTKHLQ